MKNVFFTLNIIFYHPDHHHRVCLVVVVFNVIHINSPLHCHHTKRVFVDPIFHCRVPIFFLVSSVLFVKKQEKVFVVVVVILESLLFFQYGHSNIINFRSSMIIYLRYHFDQQKKNHLKR